MIRKSPLQRTQFIMMFFAFAFGMILSSLLTQMNKPRDASATQNEILFIYRGIEKYHDDVIEEDRKKLTALARKKQAIVENAALRQYFLDQAHQGKQSLEQLIETELAWQAVTEEDLIKFYEQNKMGLDKPFSEVSADIRTHLEHQRMKIAKQALLDKLIKQGDLALLPER